MCDHLHKRSSSSENKRPPPPNESEKPEVERKQTAMLATTPIATTQTARSRKSKQSQSGKHLQLSLSLGHNNYLTQKLQQHNKHHHHHHHHQLCSSDEIDSSNPSSTSISASTTPPNEFQSYSLNYTTFMPFPKAVEVPPAHSLLHKPVQAHDLLSCTHFNKKKYHSDSVRSMSDIFGRRFATGNWNHLRGGREGGLFN